MSLRKDLDSQYTWTNNNCESYNHVLKQVVDWKSLHLLKLVQELEEIAAVQSAEARRAFIGVGEFCLSPQYTKFAISREKWQSMSVESRGQRYRKFLKTKVSVDTNVLQSTDGTSSANFPTARGKKPSQRKRKQTAKTTTPSKRSRHTVE